ncbi:MAG TPA: hypothetical protein VKP69_22555 [Isosphaeraceae bacterium]|nr:hypothetical protein [Isosphaeraceae bacterium]
MHPRPTDDPSAPAPAPQTPEVLLDALRDHPEWSESERDAQLDRLIARFPADRVRAAVRPRLDDLDGSDAEVILRLVEAHASPDLLRALAEGLLRQPDLPPERVWMALELLDGAGMLPAFPELAERWEELNETLEADESLDQLAEQLETDPDGIWLALEGLAGVEPELRPEIVSGLAEVPLGSGLIEFLRLLGFAHQAETRTAALEALSRPEDDPRLLRAWASLAADHPDAATAARARRWFGGEADRAIASWAGPDRPAPRLVRSVVTALDGRGRATILLSAARPGATRATAAFLCDVWRGIHEVVGQITPDPPGAEGLIAEIIGQVERDLVEGAHGLALDLLAGSLGLCGPEAPPALRYWLEATAGPTFRPHPVPAPFPGWDPASLPFDEMPGRVRAVLDSCPDWLDHSPLTYELAEEILLREGDIPPDPARDSGAYRYLFEHHLRGQLEHYRRMLFWMASFWQASGDTDLGRSALGLAWQLSDAQHVVPAHPFNVALTTRSLIVAQDNLRRGIDPRRAMPATTMRRRAP